MALHLSIFKKMYLFAKFETLILSGLWIAVEIDLKFAKPKTIYFVEAKV